MTLYVPEGYVVTYASEAGACFDLNNENQYFDAIAVDYREDLYLADYIKNGTVPGDDAYVYGCVTRTDEAQTPVAGATVVFVSDDESVLVSTTSSLEGYYLLPLTYGDKGKIVSIFRFFYKCFLFMAVCLNLWQVFIFLSF